MLRYANLPWDLAGFWIWYGIRIGTREKPIFFSLRRWCQHVAVWAMRPPCKSWTPLLISQKTYRMFQQQRMEICVIDDEIWQIELNRYARCMYIVHLDTRHYKTYHGCTMMIILERNLLVIDLNEIGRNPRFTRHFCLLPTKIFGLQRERTRTHIHPSSLLTIRPSGQVV